MTKTSLLVDGRGLPLSFVVSGAETPDVVLLPDTLSALVLRWREVGNGWYPTLGGDRGYTGAAAWEASAAAGYRPALQQRGGTTERIPLPAARLRRWVVERCHSWLKRFRKLTIRYEKLKCSYEGLIQLACAMICWRQTLPICG